LAKENPYYTAEDNENAIELKPNVVQLPLCDVCGCCAPKRCGHCHHASYCSREHQTLDWKSGHNAACKKIQQWQKDNPGKEIPKFSEYPLHYLFKEFELLTDPEPDVDSDEDELEGGEKDEMLRKYEDYKKNWGKKGAEGLEEGDIKNEDIDKTFKKFSKRIAREPGQVLRYSRAENNIPLWVNDKGQTTSSEVPCCPVCGSKREFEFQVLPQLLYYLKVDQSPEVSQNSLDWGTLAVYTCWKSCETSKGWAEEYVWLQSMHY